MRKRSRDLPIFDRIDAVLESEGFDPHQKLVVLNTCAKMQRNLIDAHDEMLTDDVSASER